MRGARARDAGIRRRERFGFAAAESRAVSVGDLQKMAANGVPLTDDELAYANLSTRNINRVNKLRVALAELVAEFVPAMFRPMVAPLITNLSVAKALTHFRAKGFVIEELEPGE